LALVRNGRALTGKRVYCVTSSGIEAMDITDTVFLDREGVRRDGIA
jgi:hypothetical protein